MSKNAVARTVRKTDIIAYLNTLSKTALANAVTLAALREVSAHAESLARASAQKPSKKPSPKPSPGKAAELKEEKTMQTVSSGKTKTSAKNPSATETKEDVDEQREKMTVDPVTGRRYEGYWASSKSVANDIYKGAYPWPVAHARPFPQQARFLKKLRKMEVEATANYDANPDVSPLSLSVYRGQALSRFDPSKAVGASAYEDSVENIEWTSALSSYYYPLYNVRPSKEFVDYVMHYKLKA
jgi:hypothetical protein